MGEVLEARGIQAARGWAVCPFHDDTRPSLKVYPDGFYCFVCGAGGDVISFVARLDGVSNRQAALSLASGAEAARGSPYRARIRAIRERRRRALEEEYDCLCRALKEAKTVEKRWLPFSDYWCAAVASIPRIEARLDELFRGL